MREYHGGREPEGDRECGRVKDHSLGGCFHERRVEAGGCACEETGKTVND